MSLIAMPIAVAMGLSEASKKMPSHKAVREKRGIVGS
jgi:hypothetical protein